MRNALWQGFAAAADRFADRPALGVQGEVLTYGEVADRLGDKNLAREVGRALGLNPFPPIVPCHRILAASGKTGGFSAPGGVDTKMRLLNLEKARTSAAPSLFDDLPLAIAPRR